MFGLFKNKNKIKTLIIEDINDLNINFFNQDDEKTEYYQYTTSSDIKENIKHNALTLSPKKNTNKPGTIFNFNNIEIDTVIIKNSKNIIIPYFFCKHIKNIEIENSTVSIIGFRAKHIDFKIKDSEVTINKILAQSANFSAKNICKLNLCEGAVEHLKIESEDYIKIENAKKFYAKIFTAISIESGLLLGTVNVVNTLCVDELKNGDLKIKGRPTIQYKQNQFSYYTVIEDFNCTRFKSNNKINILDDIVNDLKYNTINKPSFLIEEEKRLLKIFSKWELQEYATLLKKYPENAHKEYTQDNYKELFQKTINENINFVKKQIDVKDKNIEYKQKLKEVNIIKAEEAMHLELIADEKQKEFEIIKHIENEKSDILNSENLKFEYLKILNHEFPTDFINKKNRESFISFLGEIKLNELNEIQAFNAQNLKSIYKLNQNSTFDF